MATYQVVRFYYYGTYRRRVIKSGLTLEQAQEHCNNPETSSRTCTNSHGKNRTKKQGPWFDGYEEER